VWGDILSGHPELIERIPDGVTVAEWGYEAEHPFEDRMRAFGDKPAWVCPGTSSWSSLLGRTTNMRDNQLGAAGAGVAHGAQGFLNTDWGDGGHLQYLPVSWPGFAHGAAVSWCLDTNRDVDLGAGNDLFAALMTLGDIHRIPERQVSNNASYLLNLWYPVLRRPAPTNDELDAVDAALVAGQAAIDAATASGNGDDALVRNELTNTITLARVIVDDSRGRNNGDGSFASIAAGTRNELADRLEPVITAHRDLWLARNRVGGLSDSVSYLERLRDSYRAGEVDPQWLPPGMRPVDSN
jgi:hypothetical protein